jgi:hypothetical protein
LICRTALQRELVNPDQDVSKLCTIGTPHGGIDPELGGPIGDWIMATFGPNGSDIFSPERMREYMLPENGNGGGPPAEAQDKPWDPRVMVGKFQKERVLSIVGTNAKDYEVAYGLSARAMGEQSDGLVAIRNAYVHGSPRAYVHRAHSGRYGLVNSEEAYQNLRRFFFGSMRVEVGLNGLTLPAENGRVWQADVRLSIRGLPVLIHEQTAAHHCPVNLSAQVNGHPASLGSVPLVTTYLLPGGRDVCRYALHLKVSSLEERGGIFGFGDHLEQIADWEDTLVVDVSVDTDGTPRHVRWQWNSELSGRIADQKVLQNTLDGDGKPTVPLPDAGKDLLGSHASVVLTVDPWD